jgi:cyanophycinase-like exopeptidase
MTRLLTIMGSGETAPTMVKPHRMVFERLEADQAGGVPAVFLDTPFGFQENADELSAKTVGYFATSLTRTIGVAGLQRIDAATTLEREAAFSRVRQARFVFAGPGSPTYALRQWAGTPIPDLLAEKLRTDGAVTFSSAAALTLGLATVPVYELYKSGADPYWLDGLDLLSPLGLPVAVIPHYNNAEGGHHDTRFCYLGERRLAIMERLLPDGAFVLGLDEHTGVILDLDADTASVVGLGVLTLRRAGISMEITTGETVSIDVLRAGPESGSARSSSSSSAASATDAARAGTPPPASAVERAEAAPSLAGDAERLGAAFDDALSRRDAAAAVSAVLDLEEAIVGWSTDTLQSDATTRARALLRSMIVRLGDAAVGGLTDPRSLLGPVIEVALNARTEVRAAKRYDLSDTIRDGLAAAGVEVRDTPDGQVWELVGGE